ncbi:MAG: hypothetical protein BM485_12730 [Desulfobulbaceae bacterium DB1]|nr:MAG: hypothetical protein BM485_12730 [Desulfobulbaceae bacterium DB1]
MKPRIKVAAALTPDGGEMVLYRHDRDFSILVNGEDLMHSRRHESELALARLGCAHLAGCRGSRVLIGGLGMGYTLRQALDVLGADAQVVVGELLADVIEWNREFFGELNGRPLTDERVEIKTGDIVELIAASRNSFDAILLDIDNGPDAMTDAGNRRLYGYEGLWACRRALRAQGCLAVWSAKPSAHFEQVLMRCGFQVSRFRVAAHKGKKPQFHFVWVASEDKAKLPPGGSEARLGGQGRVARPCRQARGVHRSPHGAAQKKQGLMVSSARKASVSSRL